jgi:hypothetical protein
MPSAIRDAIEAREIAGYMAEILRNASKRSLDKDRIAAAIWLSDRGWGKPVDRLEVTETHRPPQMDYDSLSEDELDTMEILLAKASGEAPTQH